MDKRIRYLLIALGFVFFLITAPLIVLFVRGLKYDFTEKKFIATGIISIKTDPGDAEIYLNNKLAKTSSGELRFLDAKNYLISARKSGYFDWNKNLRVEPNKVAWTNPQNNKIYLLLKNQQAETILGNLQDFITWPNGSLAVSNNILLFSDSRDLTNAKKIPLPKGVSKIQASPDFQMFLLFQEPKQSLNAQVLLFDRASEKLFDLHNLFENPKKLPSFHFSQNNRLFALEETNVYEINPLNSSRQLLLSKIAAARISGQTIYYLAQKEGVNQLESLELQTGTKQTLAAGLPDFTSASIFVNAQKRIFLENYSELYELTTQGLTLIASNIKNLRADNENSPLIFLTSGELRFLDEQGRNVLITRLSEEINLPIVLKSIGYAFFTKNNLLTALELDQSDPQNSYPIYQGKNIQKYFTDETVKNFLILDDGFLKKIRLR